MCVRREKDPGETVGMELAYKKVRPGATATTSPHASNLLLLFLAGTTRQFFYDLGLPKAKRGS